MQVTITIGALQAYALAQLAAEVNAARPKDESGDPVGLEITAEQYLEGRIGEMLLDYCRRFCRISGAAFIDRLTVQEWATLKAARAANPTVAEACKPLFEGQRVELAGPLAQQGVALMVSAGLLTPARAAELLAPPQPSEVV